MCFARHSYGLATNMAIADHMVLLEHQVSIGRDHLCYCEAAQYLAANTACRSFVLGG